MGTKIRMFISIVLSIAMLILAQASSAEAAKRTTTTAGSYNNADFTAPDYANGATETVNAGATRTLRYTCACSRTANCAGYARLQVDVGAGFVNEYFAACSVTKSTSCSASYAKTFSTAGTYRFRVLCDENTGTDFVQPSTKYVTVAVTAPPTCTEGATRACPLRQGVCAGTSQTCTNNIWSVCDYGTSYEPSETTATDSLDNDCDAKIDEHDNQLVLTGIGGSHGNITVLEYDSASGTYKQVWSTNTAGTTLLTAGGEIGDLTNDGRNDFVLVRKNLTNYNLELWTYDPATDGFSRVWLGAPSTSSQYIGDIADFDMDGYNELLVKRYGLGLEIWGGDIVGGTSLSKEASLTTTCNGYIPASGDLNGNGIPEIFGNCQNGMLSVWEWDGSSYMLLANMTLSITTIDDGETGDVTGDGIAEYIFCGNSKKTHVMSYVNGTYQVIFSSTEAGTGALDFTQGCGIGDVTNDGVTDIFEASRPLLRVYTYSGSSFSQVWSRATGATTSTPIGSIAVGDADNDGKGEFLAELYNGAYTIRLYENDAIGATSFNNTHSWAGAVNNANILIGQLK